MLERLAVEAGAHEPSHLARQIHLLVRGSIIAAVEGRPDAVTEAHAAARHLLEQARRASEFGERGTARAEPS